MIQLYIYSFSDSFPLYFITRFFKKVSVYLFLAVLGLCCCTDFPLAAANGGYSLAVVRGLLIMVTSLVAEHRLSNARASVVAACELRSYSPLGSRAQQAQQLWPLGLVALQHVGSSWLKDQTRVSCIGRQVLYH